MINLIFLFIANLVFIYLLFIIDIAILMYYIVWINNVFISPLLWICVKVIYYNRTIFLFLIFYYYIAKNTIKESGYKYFLFFNIDVAKWNSIFFNYIWGFTSYNIEIISILLFFFLIALPIFIYNKELLFFCCYLIMLIFLWFRIFKNVFKYKLKKKIRIRSFLFFFLSFFIFIKISNYSFIKEFFVTYYHFDYWVFDLLEWKIKTYDKLIEKDYYSEVMGLKPKWVGLKLDRRDLSDEFIWDSLIKKKKNFLIKEFKEKIEKKKNKYSIDIESYDFLYNLKMKLLDYISELKFLQKIIKKKDFAIFKDKNKKVKVNTYNYLKKLRYENPVVLQEKEKERILHDTVILKVIHKCSLHNYYKLNLLLKDLTYNKLYYQPFFDEKSIIKMKELKKSRLFISTKDYLLYNDDAKILKEIKKKLKIYWNFIEENNTVTNVKVKTKPNHSLIFYKILDYLNIEDKKIYKIIPKFIFKILKIEVFDLDKKEEKFTIKKHLRDIIQQINLKKKTNKLEIFNVARANMLDKNSIGNSKQKTLNSFSVYIDKDKLEKLDNKVLFNKVDKYHKEKTKRGLKEEFIDDFKIERKKEKLNISNGLDLSRRNKN